MVDPGYTTGGRHRSRALQGPRDAAAGCCGCDKAAIPMGAAHSPDLRLGNALLLLWQCGDNKIPALLRFPPDSPLNFSTQSRCRALAGFLRFSRFPPPPPALPSPCSCCRWRARSSSSSSPLLGPLLHALKVGLSVLSGLHTPAPNPPTLRYGPCWPLARREPAKALITRERDQGTKYRN